MLLHGRKLAEALGLGSMDAHASGWRCRGARAGENGGWEFPLEGPDDQSVTLSVATYVDDRPTWRRIGDLSLTYARLAGNEERIRPVLDTLADALERSGFPREDGDSVHSQPSLLSALFALPSPEAFFRDSWSQAPLHGVGALHRLGELSEDPRLSSWDTLQDAHTGETIGTWVDEEGIPTEEPIPRDQVLSRRDAGWVTTLLHVERDVPVVAQWCRSLARALGTAPDSVRCGSFSANPGHGVCKHWDAEDLFLVQLRGSKRWIIAPNQDVQHPTTNCLPPHTSRELERYSTPAFGTTMPADSTTLTLNAGDVLYLPRATWHTTEDSRDGLSLSFAVSRPSWMEVVLDALEDHLIQEPAWREAAWSAAPLEKIQTLLKRLPTDWRALDPEQLRARLQRKRR